jgi:hypothetical protein
MYDNIDLRLTAQDAGGVDLLDEIPGRLTRCSQTFYDNGQASVVGYNGLLKIRVTSQVLKIQDSSLCKWYLGDNFQGMSRGDAKNSIEKLSDLLHLPMERANVTRIDAAHNFIMKHEKQIYFTHLGDLQHYQRLQQPNGLYYSTANKTLLFYEKVHEQTDKGQPIPEMYRGRQVLRYEQRYKKRLLQSFNLPEIKASALYDPAFYVGLVDRWRNDYEKIKKINDIQIDYTMIKTKKDQARQAILFYVQQRGGELTVINEIREAYKKGELTKKQAYDLREQVEEACRADQLTTTSDVIQELDKKVKEAARYYL